MQPAGNHQVERQPKIAFDSDSDTLADPAKLSHGAVLEILNRRFDGSKQKRARNSHPFERLAEDACFECADVSSDIRKFRHEY